MEVLHHKGVKNEFVLFFWCGFCSYSLVVRRIDFRESLFHMWQFGSFFPTNLRMISLFGGWFLQDPILQDCKVVTLSSL